MSRDDTVAVPGWMPLGPGPFAGQSSGKLCAGEIFGICGCYFHNLLVAGHGSDDKCLLLLPAHHRQSCPAAAVGLTVQSSTNISLLDCLGVMYGLGMNWSSNTALRCLTEQEIKSCSHMA